MKDVRAVQKGYAGGRIRKEGDTFSWNGPLGSWMERVTPFNGADPAAFDHDKNGEPGGSVASVTDESGQSAGGDVALSAPAPAPHPAKPAAPKPARRGRPPARRKG